MKKNIHVIEVDTRGYLCPKPIIMVKNTFKNVTSESQLKILSDNQTSIDNLQAFLKDNGFSTTITEKQNYQIIIASKESTDNAFTQDNDVNYYCNLSLKDNKIKDYIIAVKSQYMGFGSDELGKMLINGFFSAIVEGDTLPKQIIFYNGGVTLCTKKSTTFAHLENLSSMGVEIIVCGTCVDYYNIKSEIGIGTISNMFKICEILNSSNKIIYP